MKLDVRPVGWGIFGKFSGALYGTGITKQDAIDFKRDKKKTGLALVVDHVYRKVNPKPKGGGK
jgi:hypothetical protein